MNFLMDMFKDMYGGFKFSQEAPKTREEEEELERERRLNILNEAYSGYRKKEIKEDEKIQRDLLEVERRTCENIRDEKIREENKRMKKDNELLESSQDGQRLDEEIIALEERERQNHEKIRRKIFNKNRIQNLTTKYYPEGRDFNLEWYRNKISNGGKAIKELLDGLKGKDALNDEEKRDLFKKTMEEIKGITKQEIWFQNLYFPTL